MQYIKRIYIYTLWYADEEDIIIKTITFYIAFNQQETQF